MYIILACISEGVNDSSHIQILWFLVLNNLFELLKLPRPLLCFS